MYLTVLAAHFLSLTRLLPLATGLSSDFDSPFTSYNTFELCNQREKIGTSHPGSFNLRIMWTFIWVEIVWFSLWIAKLLAQILPIAFETIVGVINNSVAKYALILVALEMPIILVAWTFTSWVTFIPIMTGNPDQRRLNDRATKSWEDRLNKVVAALLIGSILLPIKRFVIQLLSVNYHGKQFALRIKHHGWHERQSTAMKIIGNIGRVGDKFTSAIGNVAHGNEKIFAPQSAKASVTNALEHNAASKALTKRVWMSLVSEDKEELDLADLQDIFFTHVDDNGEAPAELALECMAMLDRDSNGDVSLDEIALMFLELGREKKSVARSVHDVDNAINVLNNVLTTIVLLAAIFILIALLNQNFGTNVGHCRHAQVFLSSCNFLFVKHPYDYIVEHISLLFTIFRRVDTHKNVQFPNSVLNTLWVEKVSHSLAMQDIRFAVRHKSNMADENLRRQRRKFIFELIAACKKVPIYPPNIGDPYLGSFGQPSYLERWAKSQKDKADMKFKKPAPETEVTSARSTGIWSADPRIAELAAGVVTETQESLRRETTTGRRKPVSPHITSEKSPEGAENPELSQD
ncbi:hypothetical protein V1523DRAFT_442984 [Lipomyces doorenjongii]